MKQLFFQMFKFIGYSFSQKLIGTNSNTFGWKESLMKLIIVTGGLKTGKSTFVNYLREGGQYTISCDAIVEGILKFIRLDKKIILKYFFTHKAFRRIYLAFIIPTMFMILLVKFFFGMILGYSLIFIEVPLLYEYKLNKFFFNIVVWTSKSEQLKRIKKSGVSPKFLGMQLPIEYKKKMADYTVNNNRDLKELEAVANSIRNNSLNVYQLLSVLVLMYLL